MARYFVVNPSDGSPGHVWRRLSGFAGQDVHINFSLLAHALGDDPADLLPPGSTLVEPQDYRRIPSDGAALGPVVVPALQPFAYTRPGDDPARPRALELGAGLRAFLEDPLGGARLDLSLPFYDEQVELGPSGGGFLRGNATDQAFHAGTDFNTSPRAVFDTCAAATGQVLRSEGDCIVLAHPDSSSPRFLTVHLHVDRATSTLRVGHRVRRGQFVAAIDPTQSPQHLHFAVAVRAPALTWGGVTVDPLWHMIDPWGVYDLREGHYLPPGDRMLDGLITGAAHPVQWRTQPVSRTVPIARETAHYRPVERVQIRLRDSRNTGGTLPAETEQFLVWLADDPDFFLVPLTQAADRRTEWELATLLREAFLTGRQVRLEYRWVGDQRYIMAAWVQA